MLNKTIKLIGFLWITQESKNVGMGLIMFYTLAALAVGAILYRK